MPNRMLRDWTRSDKVNIVTVHAERFFTRLIMKVDDYGCLFSDTRLLKAELFPLLLDGVREADIARWMAECQKAGLIVLYEADSKKYLQIQDFRQRLDKARNKYPLPKSTDLPVLVNDIPAEVETEEELRKRKNTGAPLAPRDPASGEKPKQTAFKPPTSDEVFKYFLSNIGAPDHPRHWPEDKCRNQADLFTDHYATNGWVQGRGKPIKDWEAACRNWIRRELKGDFKSPEPQRRETASSGPRRDPPPAREADPHPIEVELNTMFELWSDNPEMVTVISATADHYNYLKSAGRIGFSPQEVATIQQLVVQYMTDKQLEGEVVQKRLLKAYGVLEFFKQSKAMGKATIFTL